MPKEDKTIMTVGRLKGLLAYFNAQDDFEVWLSSDEEGNDFLPMLANPKWSLAVEEDDKRVTLFPSHRRFLHFFSPQPFSSGCGFLGGIAGAMILRLAYILAGIGIPLATLWCTDYAKLSNIFDM